MPANYVLGLVCLFVLVFMRRVQVSGNKDFNKMFEVTKPSLEAGPSAASRVTLGTLGCLKAVIGIILFIVFLVLMLDAFFNESAGLMRLVSGGF